MTASTDVAALIDTVSYVNRFRGSCILIKLGGSILHDEALIKSLCTDLKLLKGAGINIVLVHGGSKAINEALAIHHIESQFVDGLRVTSPEAMKIIEMVLCGHVNKVLVRKLNAIGIPATGLSGLDNQMLLCDAYSPQHQRVGAIQQVNTHLINVVLQAGQSIPVIAPIGVDVAGNAMNINADYAASYLAAALTVDKLIYLTDQDGIYNESGAIYSELLDTQLSELVANKTVTGGMLAKTNAILFALAKGLNHIHVLNGNRNNVLIEELFTVNGVGTLCKKL